MNATELCKNLERIGIRLEVVGSRLCYQPRYLMTSDLLAELRTHKSELIRRHRLDPTKLGQALEPDDSESSRSGETESSSTRALDTRSLSGLSDWTADTIELSELQPCLKCQSLEQWESISGSWRCLHCDPPRNLKHCVRSNRYNGRTNN